MKHFPVEHITDIDACEHIAKLHPGFPVGSYVENDRTLFRIAPRVWEEAALAGLVRIKDGRAYPAAKKSEE